MGKKIMRGISENFAKAFRESDLIELYKKHPDELFIGIRNDYLNLYYNCDSIAKIKYSKGSINCEIHKYFLNGVAGNKIGVKPYVKIKPSDICEKYENIKIRSDARLTPEKKAQSKLVILNNENQNSNWFCVDVEYIKQHIDTDARTASGFNARFDIIALSKKEPHRVALIELKYGDKAIGGKSGIYKHVEDFSKFSDKEFFESHLIEEIIEIVKSKSDIGLSVPFDLSKDNIALKPEFYFITLANNKKTDKHRSPKQSMAGYLFAEKRWDTTRLTKGKSVEKDFGDITKKDNKFHATFLFSSQTLDNLCINDIIDGEYDERIVPD